MYTYEDGMVSIIMLRYDAIWYTGNISTHVKHMYIMCLIFVDIVYYQKWIHVHAGKNYMFSFRQ